MSDTTEQVIPEPKQSWVDPAQRILELEELLREERQTAWRLRRSLHAAYKEANALQRRLDECVRGLDESGQTVGGV